MYDLAIMDGRVYLPDGWHEANIYVKEGRIADVTASRLPALQVQDAQGKCVAPGLIDSHVHFDMPAGEGIRSADDFFTGSRAAAYGGVTTIIDFLDERPTVQGLDQSYGDRRRRAERCVVDYSFHTAVCEMEDSANEIAKWALEHGMPTIKVYTTYKEGGMYSDMGRIEALIRRSAERDIMVLCHSEKDEMLSFSHQVAEHGKNRPPQSEVQQVRELAELVQKHRGLFYNVHVSCGSTVWMLRQEYADILNTSFYVESCPHYLMWNDSRYHQQDGWRYTMTPPLRPEAEREMLCKAWEDLYTIATDHCPFLEEQKHSEDLAKIPQGIGGVESSFSSLYYRYGDAVLPKMTEHPARVHGLWPQKGCLIPGADADIMIYEEKECILGKGHSAAGAQLSAGMPGGAVIEDVLVRGEFVIRSGVLMPHRGRFCKRRLLK